MSPQPQSTPFGPMKSPEPSPWHTGCPWEEPCSNVSASFFLGFTVSFKDAVAGQRIPGFCFPIFTMKGLLG